MALIAYNVKPNSVKFSRDKDNNRTCQRVYHLYFDPTDNDVYVDGNLPSGLAMFTQDPDYAGYVVINYDVDEIGPCTAPNGQAGRQWDAAIQYGPWTSLLSSADGNPVNKPATIRTTSERIKKPLTEDINGNPVLNGVGDPFIPSPEIDSVANTLVIMRNEQAIDLSRNDPKTGWIDHINDAAYGPYPARTLKISPIVQRQEYHQTCGVYYPHEYHLEVNGDTWDFIAADQGYRQNDPNSTASPPPLQKVLIEGIPADEPVFLDANGHYLPPPVNKDDIHDITFEPYNTLHFDDLFGLFNNLIPSGEGTG